MRRIVQRAVVMAVLASVITGAVGVSAAQGAMRRVTLGISAPDGGHSVASLDANTAAVGRKPSIWSVWSSWGGADGEFPTPIMNVLKTRAIMPMVNWQPVDPSNRSDCTRWSLDNIIRGDHDAYITRWANAAKAYGNKVILR